MYDLYTQSFLQGEELDLVGHEVIPVRQDHVSLPKGDRGQGPGIGIGGAGGKSDISWPGIEKKRTLLVKGINGTCS